MYDEEILNKIKAEAVLNHVPILQDDSMKFISVILNIIKPVKLLEIGTAVGYSSICFSKYIDEYSGIIDTIEIDEQMYKIALNNIEMMRLNNRINVINADATKYLQNIDEEDQYDVIFIDAAKGQYLVFLEQAIRLVKDGGVIIADNVLFKGRVLSDYNEKKHRTAVNRLREYIGVINTDKRLNSSVINIGDGVAVSVVNKKK